METSVVQTKQHDRDIMEQTSSDNAELYVDLNYWLGTARPANVVAKLDELAEQMMVALIEGVGFEKFEMAGGLAELRTKIVVKRGAKHFV